MRGPSTSNRDARTKRLRLLAPSTVDLDEIAALHADERVWRHYPGGRHTSIEQTAAWLAEHEQRWARDGLGYWTARLLEPLAGLDADSFAGVGGCTISAPGDWWNLYYRLRPELHRQGLAGELCRAALSAAHATRPTLPVIARLLEHNEASKATAQRAGLELAWRGPDTGNPDPAAIRLIYADRPLDASLVETLHRPA